MSRIRIFFSILMIILLVSSAAAASKSTVIIGDGYSCMGIDKSVKQTEREALQEAKRNAVEKVMTSIKSSTEVVDFQVKNDMVNAYAEGTVEIIEEMGKGWYDDPASGRCYKMKVKANVIPNEKSIEAAVNKKDPDDPTMPLNVRIWTDKKEYRQGEMINIYLRGNKPFYARVLHKGVSGEFLQLLPNPYRKENYFDGGVTYKIPSGNDKFELQVSPPFGEEEIIIYASMSPLGDINLEEAGTVFQVKEKGSSNIAIKTRSINIKEKEGAKRPESAEIFESQLKLKTGK